MNYSESGSEDDEQPLILSTNEGNRTEWSITQEIEGYENSDVHVTGYRRSVWRRVLSTLVTVVLLGLPWLVLRWLPRLRIAARSAPCALRDATELLLLEIYQKKHKTYSIHAVHEIDFLDPAICGQNNDGYDDLEDHPEQVEKPKNVPVHLEDGRIIRVSRMRYLEWKARRWVWDGGQFAAQAGAHVGATCAQLNVAAAKPLASALRSALLAVYGLNEMKVPRDSYFRLTLREACSPLYVFQVFTIGVWLAEDYYYYCLAIVLMSVFGIATSVLQTRQNQSALSRAAAVEGAAVAVQGRGAGVRSAELVPGDVLLLPPAPGPMLCDAVLLAGQAIVNESMLTGECVPVTKTPLPCDESLFDERVHSAHTLYAGTHILQARANGDSPIRALVIRTGFGTAKGGLVRAVLHPAPLDFRLETDSYKFMGLMAAVSMLGLVYTVVLKAGRAISGWDIVIKALDLVTIAVPPALPAALTVGRLHAARRLQRDRVFCLHTRAVNLAGAIRCVCFDKTGTLTEEGLGMRCVWAAGRESVSARALGAEHPALLCLAACHSLAPLEGKPVGDPLDLETFSWTGWRLDQGTDEGMLVYSDVKSEPVRVVRRLQFASLLQRAAVVVRCPGEPGLRVLAKGSPEAICSLCLPETVPPTLQSELASYTACGYRVIALAWRRLAQGAGDAARLQREEIEAGLEFVGLAVLQNKLRPQSAALVRELRDAELHVAIITGDDLRTAECVARECGVLSACERVLRLETRADRLQCTLVDAEQSSILASSDSGLGMTPSRSNPHSMETAEISTLRVCMTGAWWEAARARRPELCERLAARAAVLARASPDHKQQMVVQYQALGYYVAMCGDGSNDCAALRAAHVGVSLSQQESGAAAAFSAGDASATARVLREGRAAIDTSFGVFKFMVAYSFAEFFSVVLLYYFDANLTDFEFLFIDVALVVNFAFFFGRTEAREGKLNARVPDDALLGFAPLLSLLLQLTLVGCFQVASYFALTIFPWYTRHKPISASDYECWENYAVFGVSSFQYITLAIVFSHGAPFRRSIVTNRCLMAGCTLATAVCAYIVVQPAEWLRSFLQLKMPLSFQMTYCILGLAGLNFVVALFCERFIVEYLVGSKDLRPRCLKTRKVSKTPYLKMKNEMTDADLLSSVKEFVNEYNKINIINENSSVSSEEHSSQNSYGTYNTKI